MYSLVKDGENKLIVECCGSYRRGKPSCGDIDILITKKNSDKVQGLLKKLVETLEKEGFLKERLGRLRLSSSGSEGYFGIC